MRYNKSCYTEIHSLGQLQVKFSPSVPGELVLGSLCWHIELVNIGRILLVLVEIHELPGLLFSFLFFKPWSITFDPACSIFTDFLLISKPEKCLFSN